MEEIHSRVQQAVLTVLAKPQNHGRSLGAYRQLAALVAEETSKEVVPTETQIMEAVWSLIGLRLVYFNYYGDRLEKPAQWTLQLTAAGRLVVEDEEINPDTADGYLRRLRDDVPAASSDVLRYATESILAFERGCYLASAVMLGVATEAAFLEMAEACGEWLSQRQESSFEATLANPRASLDRKFTEFRNKLSAWKNDLPFERRDGMDLRLNSILELIRNYRNEAGHPTGKVVSRSRARDYLILFRGFLVEIYALKAFFESELRHLELETHR